MKRCVKPCEDGWRTREPNESAISAPVGKNAIESASRSAVRRLSLLSSASLLVLAALVVPVEIDPDTGVPSISAAFAKGGGDDGDGEGGEGGGSDDGSNGGNGGHDDDGEKQKGKDDAWQPAGALSSAPDRYRVAGDSEAEPSEVVATGFDATSLAQAAALGFKIKERRRLAHLGIEVAVFELPVGLDARGARERLAALSPGAVDLNHLYAPQATLRPPAQKYAADLIGWGIAPKGCGQGLRIGIIDTPVDLNHRVFQGQRIEARSFVSKPAKVALSDHGTAVAALLVGSNEADQHAGLLPGAQLFAANIFKLREGRMRANALAVASALDWLIGQRVGVVNLSLSGPPNRLLAQAVARAAQNMILVAAAGNAGPVGKARYPAAYPDVVAVTATDSRLRPYEGANRGTYIDVAAPGVGIWTVATNLPGRYESGTSFAVPFVTAAVAALMMDGGAVTLPEIRKFFAGTALDLGEPGKDEVFGWGLVQNVRPCQKKTARRHEPIDSGGTVRE